MQVDPYISEIICHIFILEYMLFATFILIYDTQNRALYVLIFN